MVLIMIEEDKGSTDLSAKIARKEKLLPAVTLNDMLGRPIVIQFGSPINEKAVTWRAVLA